MVKTKLMSVFHVSVLFMDNKFCHNIVKVHVRASGRSREKKSNFAGFSGANSRKKRPISQEFSRPVSLKKRMGASRANFAGKRLLLR